MASLPASEHDTVDHDNFEPESAEGIIARATNSEPLAIALPDQLVASCEGDT
jgi:hypothetical protein